MKILGIVLLLAGLLGLVYGGVTYTRHREVLDVGPISAKVDEKKTVPIPPIVGALAVVAGAAMLAAGRRRV